MLKSSGGVYPRPYRALVNKNHSDSVILFRNSAVFGPLLQRGSLFQPNAIIDQAALLSSMVGTDLSLDIFTDPCNLIFLSMLDARAAFFYNPKMLEIHLFLVCYQQYRVAVDTAVAQRHFKKYQGKTQ